jgi:hypothetical protein
MSGDGLILDISPDSLDALAEKVAAIIGERSNGDSSPWLTRIGAAEYLGVSVSRLEKDRTVPAHRWVGRVMYHRGELDAHLLGLGPGP